MTPAPPAERPHGPGDPPIESPFMTIFSRSQDLRKPWKLAVKRLNYMKTAITSNVTAFAFVSYPGLLGSDSRNSPERSPRQTASGQRVMTAISENSDRPGPALDLREGRAPAGEKTYEQAACPARNTGRRA